MGDSIETKLRIHTLESEVAQLRSRLEWREDGHDGIYCRDETIRALEAEVVRLKRENTAAWDSAEHNARRAETAEAEVEETEEALRLSINETKAAEAKLRAVGELVKQPFVSLFLDGRNEYGTHFLPMCPDGAMLSENEFESLFDPRENETEKLFTSAEGAGYSVGHIVVVTLRHDREYGYWEFDGISPLLTDLFHGSAAQQTDGLEAILKESE